MRLIDADALMAREKVNPFFMAVGARNGKSLYNACLTYMAVAVGDAPTIDAAPVVRCKDCKHFETPYCMLCKTRIGAGYWSHDMAYRKPDDFCSYGERKDGE